MAIDQDEPVALAGQINVAMVRSRELLAKLELEDRDLILWERRLHWFGHVERSSSAVRTACDI